MNRIKFKFLVNYHSAAELDSLRRRVAGRYTDAR